MGVRRIKSLSQPFTVSRQITPHYILFCLYDLRGYEMMKVHGFTFADS